MPKLSIYFLIFAVVLCLPTVCKADSVTMNGITLTLTSTSLSVMEGDPLTLTFTLQNNSGVSQLFGGQTASGFFFVSGDGTDTPVSSAFNNIDCPAFLPFAPAAGSSCTFTVTLTTPSDSGETDGDSGVRQFSQSVFFCSSGCPTIGTSLTLTEFITVTDPPVTPAPEPASLFLVSAGLVGLVPLVRRRIVRS